MDVSKEYKRVAKSPWSCDFQLPKSVLVLCEYLGRKEGFGQAGGETRGKGWGSCSLHWECERGAWPEPARLRLGSQGKIQVTVHVVYS